MSMGSLKMTRRFGPLDRLIKKSPSAFKKAQKEGALAFLNWANNGSAKTSRKPPIRWGVLRGSSSVFVGSELVSVYPQIVKPGGGETISPAKSHTAPTTQTTWVWNTDYAKKMHDYKGTLKNNPIDPDGVAGNQWLLMHLRADRDDFMKAIGIAFKRITKI